MIIHHDQISPLFVVGGLYTESSGVARIVTSLANAVGRRGIPVGVYTAMCNGSEVASHLLQSPSRCVAEPGMWLGRLSVSPALNRRLGQDIPAADVVHNHSLWMMPNHYGSQMAARHRKPVIFTAHGTLEPWALQRSRWKKRLAGWWFQDKDLKRAECIQVNSVFEAENVRRYGLNNPIAVVPNGVDLEAFDRPSHPKSAAWLAGVRGKRVALFLSRMHAKKGLDRLVAAWAKAQPDHRDWHLLIAGPDDGLGHKIRRMVKSLHVEDSVTLVGARHGIEKLQCFEVADLFVLPSHSEGFSMAVLEAMASRLPVLLTEGCNFEEVSKTGAGLTITPDPQDIERGLREMFEMDDRSRRTMGDRGRALVASKFTWDRIASDMLDVYRWMVRGGSMPSTVMGRGHAA